MKYLREEKNLNWKLAHVGSFLFKKIICARYEVRVELQSQTAAGEDNGSTKRKNHIACEGIQFRKW